MEIDMRTRSTMLRSLVAGVAVFALATPVLAQSDELGSSPMAAFADSVISAAPAADSVRIVSAAPTLDGARVALRAAAPAAAVVPMQNRGGIQSSQVYMIVGAAAIALGVLVDSDASDVLIIGGAAVGLWGLWRYLKTN